MVEYTPTTPQQVALLSQRFNPTSQQPNTQASSQSSSLGLAQPKPTSQPSFQSNPGQFIKSTAPKPPQLTTIQTLHKRFAHAGLNTIEQIPTHTLGVTLSNPKERFNCEVCHLTKGKRLIRREPVPIPTQPYKVVSCDLIEFKKVNEDAGYGKWALHFYCRYTHMNHVYILPSKNEEVLYNTIKEFCAYTQRRWNQLVRIIHTDGESGLGSTTEH